MDYNQPLDLLHAAEEAFWVDLINLARVEDTLCNWVTTFHPKKLPCKLDGGL